MDITIVILRTFETAEIIACSWAWGLLEDESAEAVADVLRAVERAEVV